MRDRLVRRGPVVLVASGLALGTVGLIILSLATFQTQTSSSGSTLGGAPITLTFTVQPLNPLTAVLLAWLMAIPLVLFFYPWRFYLTTLAAPVLVALSTAIWIVRVQIVSGIVVSSAGWVFAGDALVFAGCLAEALGIASERMGRTKSVMVRLPRNRPSRSAANPPR